MIDDARAARRRAPRRPPARRRARSPATSASSRRRRCRRGAHNRRGGRPPASPCAYDLPRRRGKCPGDGSPRARAAPGPGSAAGCGCSPAGDRAAPRRGRGARGSARLYDAQHSHGQPSSTGLGSSRYCALRDVEAPAAHEQLAVARVARRHHAVEHVDAGADRRPDVLGRARRPSGSAGGRPASRRAIASITPYITSGASPTPRPPSASPSKRQRRDLGQVRAPQVEVHAALHDAEAELARRRRRGHADARPARSCAPSPPRSPRAARPTAGTRRTPSRCRCASAAWIAIARSGVSRCSLPSRCERKVTPSSSIGPPLAQAEHLVAARVGQDRARPAHEPVQPAERRDPLRARPQRQVIRVAEDDARAQALEVARRQRLDGRLRPDRHEHGRLDHAVRGLAARRRARGPRARRPGTSARPRSRRRSRPDQHRVAVAVEAVAAARPPRGRRRGRAPSRRTPPPASAASSAAGGSS